MSINEVIISDPDVLNGTPVFKGTRVPVKNLFDYLEAGDSVDNFLEDFDYIPKEFVLTVLKFTEKIFLNLPFMKILLDEQLPVKLKYRFNPEIEVSTVRDENWLGVKNGYLIQLAINTGFDVFITNDQNFGFQQRLNHFKILFYKYIN